MDYPKFERDMRSEAFEKTTQNVLDLEKALEVLGRESTAEKTNYYQDMVRQGLNNKNE